MSLEVTAGQQEQLRALAHPVRVRILSLLTGHAMSSAELARELGMKHAAVSYHVRQLDRAGFLEVAETRTVRGGHERRYRYRAGAGDGGAEQWSREDPRLVVQAVTGELTRRLSGGPGHWRVFADAELWVDPGVWEEVREQVRTAMTGLHSAARPPRSAGSVHVSATAMLFEVDAEAPGPAPAPAPEGGAGGPRPAARAAGAARPNAGQHAGDGR
jgi:DNA-binding transcriptional ArsR family regulator